jgi:hypothetical protein
MINYPVNDRKNNEKSYAEAAEGIYGFLFLRLFVNKG